MAILIENLSVVVRKDVFEKKFPKDLSEFDRTLGGFPPNEIFTDDELACISYEFPEDVKSFIDLLESIGLTFLKNNQSVDFVVVDAISGLLSPTKWLKFDRVSIGVSSYKIGICWFCDGSLEAAGDSAIPEIADIHTPKHWGYYGSSSQRINEAFKIKDSSIEQEDWFLKEADKLKKGTGSQKFLQQSYEESQQKLND